MLADVSAAPGGGRPNRPMLCEDPSGNVKSACAVRLRTREPGCSSPRGGRERWFIGRTASPGADSRCVARDRCQPTPARRDRNVRQTGYPERISALASRAPGELFEAYVKTGQSAKLANLVQEQLTEARKRCPRTAPNWPACSPRSVWASRAEEMDRGRTAPPRKPGHPREDAARRLVHLQHAVAARRSLAGPEEIRRSRTALKGYEGMKQREKTIPPQGQTRLPEALDRLIDLYTATNKPDEVKKWQAERAKYPAPPRRQGRSEDGSTGEGYRQQLVDRYIPDTRVHLHPSRGCENSRESRCCEPINA